MGKKLTAFLTISLVGLFHSPLAFTQQAQQPPGPQQGPWAWPGPWHMWHDGWGFWWICPLLMFLICGTIFLLFRRSGGGLHHWELPWQRMGRPGHGGGDITYFAVQILNERFAKGEIQKQEYEEKKATILSSEQG